ncbi:N2227-domain-containing protein [Obba rivulosa]|uniref:carnosine N-methyltransferase n=1 Tax=Obba rivulosa TaxID=1052685 RepID=A0A8E2DKI8_9APHY|nr:N2227-domain-containing protein [Obba rivulosa]
MPFSEAEIEEEQTHFANVIATFRQYARYSLAANNRRRKDYFTLPIEDRELLDSLKYKEKLAAVDHAILVNAQFINEIVANPEIFGDDVDSEEEGQAKGMQNQEDSVPNSIIKDSPCFIGHCHPEDNAHPHGHSHSSPLEGHSHSYEGPSRNLSSAVSGRARYRPNDHDMEKLRSTLKQLVRDWSGEGIEEREATYTPMKSALLEHFKEIPQTERGNLRVLVPGAGLGRLAWDVAKLGFTCQGNEFSHYMLLASFFILNRTDEIEKHVFYPYVHSFSNLPDNTAMLRPIAIPDVLPSSLPEGSNFSLVAGDFEEIYGSDDHDGESQAGQWDAIMTCFFIDTAKNVVNYLRIIHRILAPGGIWINLGPLLWHWENNTTNDPSIELTLEEVKDLARKMGFHISNERTIDTTYTNNTQSMLGYVYHTAFWTATRAA